MRSSSSRPSWGLAARPGTGAACAELAVPQVSAALAERPVSAVRPGWAAELAVSAVQRGRRVPAALQVWAVLRAWLEAVVRLEAAAVPGSRVPVERPRPDLGAAPISARAFSIGALRSFNVWALP